jgi:hypothetical protein
MEKEKLESLLIEFIDGTINEPDRKLLEKELKENPEAALLHEQTKKIIQAIDRADHLEVPSSLKTNFEKELQLAIDQQQKEPKVIALRSPYFLRMAASLALVLVSVALIFWIVKGVQRDRELAELKVEMEKTKTIMMAMLENQSSAGQRIQGVNVAYQMKDADDGIVDALVRTMDHDPNTNVRLAAMDALGQFHKQSHVRSALIKSLGTQTDPIVQIALIRLLVEIKEMQSLEELKRISTDENMLPAVQDEAHVGIMKLS